MGDRLLSDLIRMQHFRTETGHCAAAARYCGAAGRAGALLEHHGILAFLLDQSLTDALTVVRGTARTGWQNRLESRHCRVSK